MNRRILERRALSRRRLRRLLLLLRLLRYLPGRHRTRWIGGGR